MKAELTPGLINKLQPATASQIVWDTQTRGFALKVTPGGVKTYMFVYRFPRSRAGKVRWYKIGRTDDLTVKQAREEADTLRGDYIRNLDPMARVQAGRRAEEAKQKAPKRSVEAIAKEFVERYAKKRNRSWEETQRILNHDVIPAWGKRQISDISRADVNELLDTIEDRAGAPMATAVLAQVRKMFAWHATRDDKFNSPIVKGMARTSPKKMKRDRILSDNEIRVMWEALDASTPPYRQLVRFLLFTAQRRSEAAKSLKAEFKADTWEVPPERIKVAAPHVVPLSEAARGQIEELGDLLDLGDHVFTTTGDKPFSGFSKAKAQLDAEMEGIMRQHAGAKPSAKQKLLKPWRLHDLRRTAKTLMQRAGVRPDISERVLGHVIPGVEGTYDRYQYLPEKRHALTALSLEIKRVLSGAQNENVVPLRASHASAGE